MNDIEKQILENELALALDAAEKGDKARLKCAAMELEIKSLKEYIEELEEENVAYKAHCEYLEYLLMINKE